MEPNGLPLRTGWNRAGGRQEPCPEEKRAVGFRRLPALRDGRVGEAGRSMADTDTVAKYRRSIATRIEWSLRTNQPEQRLREAAEAHGGRTLLRNVPAASRPSPLSKPRVLREAAREVAELERAAGATYTRILAKLKGRYGRTTLGSVFAPAELNDDWANVPKTDAQPALEAFREGCASVPLNRGVRQSALRMYELLTSATGRQLSDLGHLQDVDLDDWRIDHGVLRNVLRKLGNPAGWIQTWLDAGIPSNVVTRREYTNSYSVLVLNAVVAAIVLALLAGGIYIVYLAGGKVATWFAELDVVIQAASIAVGGAVLTAVTALIVKKIENKHAVDAQFRKDKADLFLGIHEGFRRDVFIQEHEDQTRQQSGQLAVGLPSKGDVLVQRFTMMKFDELKTFAASSVDKEQTVFRIGTLLKLYGELVLTMRKDLGLPCRGLDGETFGIRHVLRNPDLLIDAMEQNPDMTGEELAQREEGKT